MTPAIFIIYAHGMKKWISFLVIATTTASTSFALNSDADPNYLKNLETWRKSREQMLIMPQGWLEATGLF